MSYEFKRQDAYDLAATFQTEKNFDLPGVFLLQFPHGLNVTIQFLGEHFVTADIAVFVGKRGMVRKAQLGKTGVDGGKHIFFVGSFGMFAPVGVRVEVDFHGYASQI